MLHEQFKIHNMALKITRFTTLKWRTTWVYSILLKPTLYIAFCHRPNHTLPLHLYSLQNSACNSVFAFSSTVAVGEGSNLESAVVAIETLCTILLRAKALWDSFGFMFTKKGWIVFFLVFSPFCGSLRERPQFVHIVLVFLDKYLAVVWVQTSPVSITHHNSDVHFCFVSFISYKWVIVRFTPENP